MPTIPASHLLKISQSDGASHLWHQNVKKITEADAKRAQQDSLEAEAHSEETTATVTLMTENYVWNTPSITVSAARDSPPTMDIKTWFTLGMHTWSPIDVHITLMHRPRRKHQQCDECKLCVKASWMNFYFMWGVQNIEMPADVEGYWADRNGWRQRQERLERPERNEKVNDLIHKIDRELAGDDMDDNLEPAEEGSSMVRRVPRSILGSAEGGNIEPRIPIDDKNVRMTEKNAMEKAAESGLGEPSTRAVDGGDLSF